MAKANKRQALGRGLSALLNDPQKDIQHINDKGADQIVGNILEIPLDQIQINPYQPRTNFNESALSELTNSISELGLVQPITVRKIKFQTYQLISGERRLRAVKNLGLESIPAFVRIANDNESLAMALVENIQREDLDPIEIALCYQRLIEEVNLTQEELSVQVGKKRSTVTNYLRLLRLDPIIQTGMRDGFISMGHGRALVNVEKKKDQLALYEKIISQGLSVRAIEALVKHSPEKTIKNSTSTSQKKSAPFHTFFQLPVSVKYNSTGGGTLSINFKSQEEFIKIKKKLNVDQ